MKVLLVQPGAKTLTHRFGLPALSEPLALEVLASYLPGHDVRILDLRIEDTLDESLRGFAPDVVGVTSLTTEVYDAHLVLDRTRQLIPKAVTVVGGIHASLMPQDFERPSVDVIVRGEGELTLREIVSALESGTPLTSVRGVRVRTEGGGYRTTPDRTERLQINDAPLPRRDLTERLRGHYHFFIHRPCASLETARGCPFRCHFCSVWKMHPGRCRYMSAERVLRELESIKEPHTFFTDDNFLGDIPRAQKLREMIRASGLQKTYGMQARSDTIAKHPKLIEQWREIGLGGILIGFEAADHQGLSKLNKSNSLRNNDETIRICKANGVDMWAAFIVDPEFDVEDFHRLSDYIRSRDLWLRQFTILTPLPGTPLFEQESKRLVTRDYRLYDCMHSVLPTKLPREQFYRHFAQLYRRSYGLRTFLRSFFTRGITLGEIWSVLPLLAKLRNPRSYLEAENVAQVGGISGD